jgi:uncharacterized protein (TIGR02996 family)
MNEDSFLHDILSDPSNTSSTWLVLSDWLEERGDPRAELTRLLHDANFRPDLSPEDRDERVRELLASGVCPVVPTVTNSIGMRLALVPAGTFRMGSPETEEGRREDEGPQHEVEITQPFLMGVYPVTQAEYRQVMGRNPSYFSSRGSGKQQVKGLKTAAFPVENVSWEEAVEFCRRLSERSAEKEKKRLYRLPSEAEWEYSCRGGAPLSSPFHFGTSLCSTQANFDGENPYGGAAKGPHLDRTCAVGLYPPNAFGLFDLHGNVFEWCADWYAENSYSQSPRQNPQGPQEGTFRVLRGGSCSYSAQICRSACRDGNRPDYRYFNIGVRVVCAAPGSG